MILSSGRLWPYINIRLGWKRFGHIHKLKENSVVSTATGVCIIKLFAIVIRLTLPAYIKGKLDPTRVEPLI
jgi:hypothetical protein